MSDDADARFERHEAIMTGLARMLEAQHITNVKQDALNARLTTVIERLDARQAETSSLLASLNTKYQRMDVSLIYLDQAMTQQTALLTQLADILVRHEATFDRLGRLLDERLPPAAGNGR